MVAAAAGASGTWGEKTAAVVTAVTAAAAALAYNHPAHRMFGLRHKWVSVLGHRLGGSLPLLRFGVALKPGLCWVGLCSLPGSPVQYPSLPSLV